jgi:DNA-directed RNA polymerase subunit RPC12/RpoP
MMCFPILKICIVCGKEFQTLDEKANVCRDCKI